MPKKKNKGYNITLDLENNEIRLCTIFSCTHGVYPHAVCCRECPKYDECEDHCLNHYDRCRVWEWSEAKKNREKTARSLPRKSGEEYV